MILVARVLMMTSRLQVRCIGDHYFAMVCWLECRRFPGGRTDDQHEEERRRDKPRQATQSSRQWELFISGHRLQPDAMSIITNISTAASTLLDPGQPPFRTTVSGDALAGISASRNNLTGGQET